MTEISFLLKNYEYSYLRQLPWRGMSILKTYLHHSLLPIKSDVGMFQENKYNVLTEKRQLISKSNYNILINYISKNLGNSYRNEF